MTLGLSLHLWQLILLPLLPLALVRRSGRIVIFLIGIAFFVGIVSLLGSSDSYGLVVPFWGLAFSLACVIAELPAHFIRRLRMRRQTS